MDRRRALVVAAGLPLTVVSSATACSAAENGMIPEVPTITVKELSEGLRKDGFQHRYLARQIRFECVCVPLKGALDKAEIPYCLIDGLEKSPMPKARLYNGNVELKKGMRLSVHGLIVHQDYGVWSIWVYSASELS